MEKICLFCAKNFIADNREIKRGNAKYCCISCACKHRNQLKPFKTCKCVTCSNLFESKSTKAKYCCKNCKGIDYRRLISTAENGTRKLQTILLSLSCANCNWSESSRDVHHIVPSCLGGKNELNNLITLCPNCHRMAHRNLLSEDKLKQLVYFRTISSSSIAA